MRFGVCYYPEHWPQTRWAEDAAAMRALGIDLVRIGEFAWTKMEPAPEKYDWAWLDEIITVLADAGHQVILGTPSAAPPVWLTRSQPDIRRVDPDGRRRDHGTRRHYCPNNPTYREHSRRIVRALAERYGHRPEVIGWQIDNEFGGGKTARCYCDACATAFRRWLRDRYENIDALNDAWGNVFWSQTYAIWSEINPPHNGVDKRSPSHELDYFRFCSDSYVSYQAEQVNILRQLAPQQWVTHNFMGLYRDLDQFALAADLDFVTWDNYPTGNGDRWHSWLYPAAEHPPAYAYDVGDPLVTQFAHDLTRGLKQAPFWIMEQQCGHINWGDVNPAVRPGTTRLWAAHAAAAGASTIVYFRWRATRFAHEQYHSGLLRHDGRPDVGYGDQQQLLAHKSQLDALTAAPLDAPAGILFDFADLWALQLQPHRSDFNYLGLLFVYYRALQALGIPVNIVGPGENVTPYRLLLAPCPHLADRAQAERLADYAAGGGRLLLGVRSGFKTGSNLVSAEPLPGALRELAGVTVTDWQSLPDGIGWELNSAIDGMTGPAGYWVETLEPGPETTLLVRYAGGAGAISRHPLGRGAVFYAGFYPTLSQAAALLRHLAAGAAVPMLDPLSPGLVARRRGRLLFLANFTDTPLSAKVEETAFSVPGRDFRILELAGPL